MGHQVIVSLPNLFAVIIIITITGTMDITQTIMLQDIQ
jgi:hypothetical protein